MRIRLILMATVAAPLMLGVATVSYTPAMAQSKQELKEARKDADQRLKEARKGFFKAEKQFKQAKKSGKGVEEAQEVLEKATAEFQAARMEFAAAMKGVLPADSNANVDGNATVTKDDASTQRDTVQPNFMPKVPQLPKAAETETVEPMDSKEVAREAEQQRIDDEERRARRAERRERLRQQEEAAARGTTQPQAVEIIKESEAVGTELDASQERQVERMRARLREQQRQIDDLERNQAEGAQAERDRTAREGEVVRTTRDGRTIRRQDDQLTIRSSDDNERFLRHARDVVVEDLPRGRTRTTVTRANGSQIVTVRNRDDDIIYRFRRRPNGDEIVLIDNRDRRPEPGINFQVQLPRLVVPIPRNEYIVDLERSNRRQLREALIAPPVEKVERVYTLQEVRQSERLRDKVRRVDLDTVTFETGSAEISQRQVLSLAEIGYAMEEVLTETPDAVFLIEGHTDAVGSDFYNLELSDKRAESVAIVLSENFDIPPENLITQGYGEEFLKIETLGPERRNRRVTVRPITDLIRPTS